MNVWLIVVAAGVASYALRLSMVALGGRAGIPPAVERATRFAVPVAFAALAATALAPVATTAGTDVLAPAGAIVAAVVAVRRTGNATASLVAGIPVLWLLSALPL